VIDRGEREVHRRRLRAPHGLEVALEVADRVVTRVSVGERIPTLPWPARQELDEAARVAAVRAARRRREWLVSSQRS
jgi:hypothetical protein